MGPGSVQANGFLGALAYVYWPHSEWGLELSASLLGADVSAGEATSRMAFLIGTSYHPEALRIGTSLRPYLTGAVGPYLDSTTASYAASAQTETAIGARLGAGLDAFPGRWLRLGVRSAYHVVPRYEDASGKEQRRSGLQVSLEIGIMRGGR